MIILVMVAIIMMVIMIMVMMVIMMMVMVMMVVMIVMNSFLVPTLQKHHWIIVKNLASFQKNLV